MTGHETPFGELQSLRERPIVGNLELGAAHGYRSVAIARDGAANAEPLLEAEAFGLAGRNYYASPINPPYYHIVPGSIDRLWLRRSVGVRLRALNDRLNASGLELFLYDAWRPQAVQRYFHDVWFPAEMRRRHPQLEGGALRAAVEALGASCVVIAGSTTRARLHAHVADARTLFDTCARFGRVEACKADDMFAQQRHTGLHQEVAIITDSSADLPPGAAERLNIDIVPLRINFGERDYLDGISLMPSDFFRRLRGDGILPRTSQPPPGLSFPPIAVRELESTRWTDREREALVDAMREYDALIGQVAVSTTGAFSGGIALVDLSRNGVPYVNKPPLHFWLNALAFRFLGMSTFTAILVPGLLGVACVLLVYALVRRTLSDCAAFPGDTTGDRATPAVLAALGLRPRQFVRRG